MKNVSKRFEAASDLTIFTVTGKVDREEIEKAIADFYAGTITKNVLWDLEKGNFELISNDDIQDLVNIPRSHQLTRKGGKTAIVADKDLAYGMARIYEARSQLDTLPFDTKVFRTLEEAYQWLNSK